MTYDDLLKSHLKYGTRKEDIIKDKGYEKILENVIIAPWWDHNIFDNMGFKCEQVSDKVFNMYNDKISFSYIELKRIGAPAIMDFILALGVTKCKNLIFLGSVGSLDKSINIGDIIIPLYSICGDGASRYLNDDLEDEFLKKEYPSENITNELINTLREDNISYYRVPNYSTDSLFGQFYHLDKIIGYGSKTIEMETALLFKCKDILNINVTALLCVSDNVVLNKSLYSGRSDEERKHRYSVRYEIIPKIIIKTIEKIS